MNAILLPEINKIQNGNAWVFCANRKFSKLERKTIEALLTEFVSSWQAHGQAVHGLFQIVDDTLVIVCSDNDVQNTTGCSIDALMGLFRVFQDQLDLDFFNRFNIPVLRAGSIEVYSTDSLKQAITENEVSIDDTFINLGVSDITSLKSKLLLPIKNSWIMNHAELS
jgi:hypothetical protein